MQWAIGKNLSTVDIRVNPESFGPMNMRLVQKGQQVQLVIRTQDEASANLLTQALGGLKEVLAQNGLQLNQVQIQHNSTLAPKANPTTVKRSLIKTGTRAKAVGNMPLAVTIPKRNQVHPRPPQQPESRKASSTCLPDQASLTKELGPNNTAFRGFAQKPFRHNRV